MPPGSRLLAENLHGVLTTYQVCTTCECFSQVSPAVPAPLTSVEPEEAERHPQAVKHMYHYSDIPLLRRKEAGLSQCGSRRLTPGLRTPPGQSGKKIAKHVHRDRPESFWGPANLNLPRSAPWPPSKAEARQSWTRQQLDTSCCEPSLEPVHTSKVIITVLCTRTQTYHPVYCTT